MKRPWLVLVAVICTLVLVSATAYAAPKAKKKTKSSAAASGGEFDFALTKDYLLTLEEGHTILPTFRLKMGDHSALHSLASDCEMHVAGEPVGFDPGSPTEFVVEPPNLCKIGPGGGSDSTSQWASTMDGLKDETCEVSGFPRIFTEHAKSAGGASNPFHVLEIHPATAIRCGANDLSFATYLKVFPGMRSIQPPTASECIGQRTLQVRYNAEQKTYVFKEGKARCGNFAVFEADSIYPASVQDVGGGHSAIARGSADGQSMLTLKLYTVSNTPEDRWLAGMDASHKNQQAKYLLGLITYDYFAILKVVHPRGQAWSQNADWTDVPYPLAFVVFGEVDAGPWEQD